jgi:hypothetical protein
MAEFLGTSYLTVAAFAMLPAILYYVAVFMAVHFEARAGPQVGLPKADLPRLKEGAAGARPPVPAAGHHHRRAAERLQRPSRRCGIGSVVPTVLAARRRRATPSRQWL